VEKENSFVENQGLYTHCGKTPHFFQLACLKTFPVLTVISALFHSFCPSTMTITKKYIFLF